MFGQYRWGLLDDINVAFYVDQHLLEYVSSSKYTSYVDQPTSKNSVLTLRLFVVPCINYYVIYILDHYSHRTPFLQNLTFLLYPNPANVGNVHSHRERTLMLQTPYKTSKSFFPFGEKSLMCF